MLGRSIPQAKAKIQKSGEVVLGLHGIHARHSSQVLDGITLDIRAGEILGIAGVSGNGQNLLADVVSLSLIHI